MGGDLISTSRWTGFRLGGLLDEAGLRGSAAAILIEAADGYDETVTLDDARDPRTRQARVPAPDSSRSITP